MSRRLPRPLLRPEPLEDRLAPAAGDLDPTFGTAGVALNPLEFIAAGAPLPDEGVVVAGFGFAAGGTGSSTFAVAELRPDGTLNPAFGNGGRVIITFPGEGTAFATTARAVAVQPDGRIVAAGQGPRGGLAAARLNPDGSLDTTFGSGGTVSFPTVTLANGIGQEAVAAAVQPDGRIVLGGTVRDPSSANTDFVAIRLNPDGSLDTTFGSGGTVIVPFDVVGPSGTSTRSDVLQAVVVQPDGKLVLVGSAESDGGDGLSYRERRLFAAARLNSDGSLDPTFDGDGKVTVAFDGAETAVANAAALQPDGRLVLAGFGGQHSGTIRGAFIQRSGQFALARLNPDGSLDGGFGAGGRLRLDADPPGHAALALDEANAVAVQPGGKIVAAGFISRTGQGFNPLIGPDAEFAAVRLNLDGSSTPRSGRPGG